MYRGSSRYADVHCTCYMENIHSMNSETREQDLMLLRDANETLKAMDIKGKDYIPVNERIKAFRMIYPRGQIYTEIIGLADGVCTMKCTVFDDEGKILATGHGQEKEGSTFINKTSYVENCETSCIGRALGAVGIGLDNGFASYEEVANAKVQQGESLERKNINKDEWESLKRMYSKEEIKEMYVELNITKGTDIPVEYYQKKKAEYDEKFNQEHPNKEFF